MLLIFSEQTDKSTSDVIDWLLYHKIKYIRINENQIIHVTNIEFNNGRLNYQLHIGDINIQNSEINGVWYRRGDFVPNFGYNYYHIKDETDIYYNEKIFSNRQTKLESHFLRNYILSDIFSKKHVNSIFNAECNKLLNLTLAKNFDLNVPEFIITNSKKSLLKFFSNADGKIISKFISPGFASFPNGFSFTNAGTVKITTQNLYEMPDYFQTTFFQKEIVKKFEIRIFYLNNKLYSEAIFSQNDEQTKIDFRHYNLNKPNRTVPFELPNDVTNSLLNLLNKIKLNCASIDMIYSTNKQYYFLEINPLGQFWQVSYPCNYYLENEIAKYLKYNQDGK
jgi:ATP-GRASP peptide maturase of grasp-with-spasm system